MLLPNAARAVVEERKLANYCLSSLHPVGRHKAAVFRSAFGFGPDDAPSLRELVLKAALTVEAQIGSDDEFGRRYHVDFPVPTLTARTATVRAAWIVRTGEDFPRLTTCYVLSK